MLLSAELSQKAKILDISLFDMLNMLGRPCQSFLFPVVKNIEFLEKVQH